MADEKKQIYHERQKLQFCLLHSLNNLFQEKHAFTRKDLDDIAEKLVLEDPYKGNWTPFSVIFKPHHNSLTGARGFHRTNCFTLWGRGLVQELVSWYPHDFIDKIPCTVQLSYA
ncbi:josephin-like protein isoform X2 [Cynara cardunculus var. scolymus]|uniref:josephin-like protein isoform X2 n=1 Tax=Cynara cardunculus var. scolymus TaxID=59895 RepID=UPI000D624B96|nr:josephin-like protein isoform X2 [Cynara cardunculus var. scolymus]